MSCLKDCCDNSPYTLFSVQFTYCKDTARVQPLFAENFKVFSSVNLLILCFIFDGFFCKNVKVMAESH